MFDLKEQQQLTEAIREYFYLSSKPTELPVILKQLFEAVDRPLEQLRYLYEPLRDSSAIGCRQKLEELLDCMERLTWDPYLGTLVQGLAGEQERSCTELVQWLLRFPRALANFRTNIDIGKVHSRLVEGLPQLNHAASQLEALSILMVLRETELILQNSAVLKIAASSLLQFKSGYSLVLAAIREKNVQALNTLAGGLAEDELIKMLVDHVLFVETLKPSAALLLFDICSKFLSPAGISTIFKKIVFQWASPNFARIRSPNSQKMLSNLISQLLGRVNVNEEDVIMAVNKGITCRFQYFKEEQFVCQSAVIVLKHYAKALGLSQKDEGSFDIRDLSDLYPLDSFADGIEQEIPAQSIKTTETLPHQLSHKQDLESESNPTINQENSNLPVPEAEQEELAFRPKNLYDCYLGLLGESLQRKRYCLNALETLIRQQCSDLVFVWQNLLSVLLTLKDQKESITNFVLLRTKAISSLIIFRPIDVVQTISDHFYRDCSLTDRLFLLDTMATAVRQLADNPMKYRLVEEEEEEESYYFKKIASKYTKPNSSEIRAGKQEERSTRVEQNSRRWGHTRILHNRPKPPGQLVSMSRQQLMIVGESSPFLNRLYVVVDQMFFRFVLPLRNRSRQLKDVLYACSVLHLLSEFAHNIKNYHGKYNIIEEMLELHQLINVKDIAIERKKLSLLLKISTTVDSNLSRHSLVLELLLKIVQTYQDDKYPWFDPSLRMLVQLLTQNIRKVLSTFSLTESWQQS